MLASAALTVAIVGAGVGTAAAAGAINGSSIINNTVGWTKLTPSVQQTIARRVGATGPKGATGATGPSAASSSTTVVTAGAAGTGTVTAACPAGKVAIGGGGSDTSTTGFVNRSAPSVGGTPVTSGHQGNGWTVKFLPVVGTDVITAYAVCSS